MINSSEVQNLDTNIDCDNLFSNEQSQSTHDINPNINPNIQKPNDPVNRSVTNIYLSNRKKSNIKKTIAKQKKTVKLKKKEQTSNSGYKAPKKRPKIEKQFYIGRYPPRWEEYSLWTKHRSNCKHVRLCTYDSMANYTFDVCKICKLPYNFSNDPYNPKNPGYGYDSEW
jgi:hypothetical protein